TYWWRGTFTGPMLLKSGGVPHNYITNSFFGLTVREFLPYTVAEFYKPWQGAEIGYLIFKIPKRSREKGKSITIFAAEEIKTWKKIDPWNLGSGNGTVRISS